jgi:hypothetical protein
MKTRNLLAALPLLALAAPSFAADDITPHVRMTAGAHIGVFRVEDSTNELQADNHGIALSALVQTASPLRLGIDIRKGDLTNGEFNGAAIDEEGSFDEMTLFVGAKLDGGIVLGLSRVRTEIESDEIDDTRFSFGFETETSDIRSLLAASLITGDLKGFSLEANSTYFVQPEFGFGIYAKFIKAEIDDSEGLDQTDFQLGVNAEYRFSM